MRPFFSIIIPCYNSDPVKIKELFDSIIKAGCNDISEIIVSDDRSTDKSYLKTVKEYKDKFNSIKIVSVPELDISGDEVKHCPGNTREFGVFNASGEWVTFIDHDDLFLEDSLTKIKEAIENNNEKYIVSTLLRIHNTTTDETYDLDETSSFNWLHGKFCNLDNFWKEFDIHFVPNLESYEDIALTSKIKCIVNTRIENTTSLDFPVYIWRKYPDSLSHTRYGTESQEDYTKFIYDYFNDFMISTPNIYVEDYEELLSSNKLDDRAREFHKYIQTDIILYMYFYIQVFKYRYGHSVNTLYEASVKKYIHDYYDRFQMLPYQLYDYVCTINDTGYEIWFTTIKKMILQEMGYFVETDTFYDFISK